METEYKAFNGGLTFYMSSRTIRTEIIMSKVNEAIDASKFNPAETEYFAGFVLFMSHCIGVGSTSDHPQLIEFVDWASLALHLPDYAKSWDAYQMIANAEIHSAIVEAYTAAQPRALMGDPETSPDNQKKVKKQKQSA